MMALRTRLTERLGIRVPILSAPMGVTAGGRMASAVTEAGGLGLIAGLGPAGIANSAPWIEAQYAAAGNSRVGGGFITWMLASQPDLLDRMLDHAPVAVMLSFGDAAPFAPAVKRAGALLICQVQSMRYARQALDCGADIIVAQGGEAGGHGTTERATFTLVPEVADLLAKTSPDTLLIAAGGIGDGRGLAAALMLGADGVLIGSRFWTSAESLAATDVKRHALAADGDATIRTNVGDIANNSPWPTEFTGRILRNDLTDRWHGKEDALRAEGEAGRDRYRAALKLRDFRQLAVHVGEVAGLMTDELPVSRIVETIIGDAEKLLLRGAWQRA
jgi:nitronate monooxygenase